MSAEPDREAVKFLGKPYRRTFIVLLLAISVMNFADRAVFSALAQTIKADMALTDLQLGLLQGLVFAFLYSAVGLPIGLMSERFARTRIIAAATTIWSAATIATGLAGNFAHLVAARLVVGMGEAGFTPPTASMVADITPRRKRASVMSIILLGSPFGAFIGATLAGVIAADWGWRAAFLAFGVPGFLLAVALLLFVAEPPRGLVDGKGSAAGPAPSLGSFLREVGRNGPLKWVIAGGSLAGFGMTSISQFLAVFLARTHELEVREAATAFGSVSGISITAGLLIGSFGTDYLSGRDPRWPAWGAAIGLATAPFLYWTAFNADSLWTSIAVLVVAGAFLLMFFGPTSGMTQNLLPPRMRASGSALYTLCYTLIGSGLGPVFVGGASDFFGARAYAGNYTADCPNGLPPAGADAVLARACEAASANGLEMALSISVSVFFVSALCYLMATPGLLAKAREAERAAVAA